MKKLINRLIKSLVKSGRIKNVVTVTYQGKGISLNDFYKQGHWSNRSKIKNKYSKIFSALLHEALQGRPTKFFDRYYVIVNYNSLHDPDNVVGMVKVFVDTLKTKWVREDDKRYFKGFAILPDKELPFNTFKFIITDGDEEQIY